MEVAEKIYFEKWVHQYSDSLFSRALSKTSDSVVSEDLVQETFFAAYRSIDSFRNDSDPKTWLMSILNNKIADYFREYYRKHQNTTVSFESYFETDNSWKSDMAPESWELADEVNLLDDPRFVEELQHCIRKLPPVWRNVILLKYSENKNTAEICQELEIKPTNYWQIMHRAKLQLRRCLEINWFT